MGKLYNEAVNAAVMDAVFDVSAVTDDERVRLLKKSNRVIRQLREVTASLAATVAAYDTAESERIRLKNKSNRAIRKLNAIKREGYPAPAAA